MWLEAMKIVIQSFICLERRYWEGYEEDAVKIVIHSFVYLEHGYWEGSEDVVKIIIDFHLPGA